MTFFSPKKPDWEVMAYPVLSFYFDQFAEAAEVLPKPGESGFLFKILKFQESFSNISGLESFKWLLISLTNEKGPTCLKMSAISENASRKVRFLLPIVFSHDITNGLHPMESEKLLEAWIEPKYLSGILKLAEKYEENVYIKVRTVEVPNGIFASLTLKVRELGAAVSFLVKCVKLPQVHCSVPSQKNSRLIFKRAVSDPQFFFCFTLYRRFIPSILPFLEKDSKGFFLCKFFHCSTHRGKIAILKDQSMLLQKLVQCQTETGSPVVVKFSIMVPNIDDEGIE